MSITCPKCGYTRNPSDRNIPETECPRCGVIYAKVKLAPRDNDEDREAVPAKSRTWSGILKTKDEDLPNGGKAAIAVIMIGLAGIFLLGGDDEIKSATEQQVERERKEARSACADRVRSSATVPSSVDISWFTGALAEPYRGGWMVRLDFTAQNILGAETPHRATCIVDSNKNILSYTVKTR